MNSSMKVLFDTNIWLDTILDRKPYATMSHASIAACINDEVDICIAAASLKDIFYMVRKEAGIDQAYQAVEAILQIADVLAADQLICDKALWLERPDYEDGLIAAMAITEGAHCIVSRDAAAFNDLDVPKYSPEKFLEAQGYNPIEI